MNAADHALPRLRRSAAFATILAAAAAGCATPSNRSERQPASPRKAVETLLQAAAAEQLGLYAHIVYLDLMRKRADLKVAAPVPLARDGGAILRDFRDDASIGSGLGLAVVHALVPASLLMGAPSSQTGLPKYNASRGDIGAKGISRFAGIPIAVGVVGTSAYVGSAAYSLTVANHHRPNDVVGWLQLKLRPGAVARHEAALAEEENARIRAEFVAETKKAADELAHRIAAVFRFDADEANRLERRIEEKIAEAFRTSENRKPGDEIQIGIPALLRRTVPDAEDRVRALHLLFARAEEQPAESAASLDSPSDVRRWLDRSVSHLRERAKELMRIRDDLRVSENESARSLAGRYLNAAVEAESLADKLELHARILGGAIR